MLSTDRNTPRAEGDFRVGAVAAAQEVFAGSLVMRNAAGYLAKGAAAVGAVGVGRAEQHVVNDGAAGDKQLKFRPGVYRFQNSAAADAIAIADIGKPCFIVDDETVAKTNGANTRSVAGFIDDVDAQGVWVRFDEALARTYILGTA